MTDQGELGVRPREAVAALAPYVPGRHASTVMSQYGLDRVTKLASNENPFGPSPRAVEAARQALAGVHAYPDGASTALRDRLAEQHGLARENVVVGNGSDEIILLLALAYLEPGTEAILATPPYSIHRTAVVASGGTPIGVPLRAYTHDLEAMAGAITDRTRLVFIANPHNPTGTYLDAAVLRRFVGALPSQTLLAVDEAYHEFVDDALRHSARDLLDDHPNVVTLRTFSKTYGLAGLRAGYALAHREIVATLDRIRPPFGLNAVAQAAALAALDDHAYVSRVVAETRAGRARLLEIAHEHGLEVVPSQANFVAMHAGDSRALSEALLRRGVIVRPGENLGLPGWIRVSVGTADEIERFAAALDACLAGRPPA
ncbi:MAG TPA: histidinol-phosphate transaminase [Chloroflexota bacterium]|nr:histidinol-phosphate transaminase [Chloroflexota bacterium]